MGKESVLEKRFVAEANEIDGVWIMPKIESSSVRGISDRLGLANGVFLALEFKSTKKDMYHPRTRLQKYFLECVEKYGGVGHFVYEENYEEIMDEIRRIASEGIQEAEQ